MVPTPPFTKITPQLRSAFNQQHDSFRHQNPNTHPTRLHFPLWIVVCLFAMGLSGCSLENFNNLAAALPDAIPTTTPEATVAPQPDPPPDTFGGLVTSISNYTLPTPPPTPEAKTTVIVNTSGARANIRNGPGLNFAIVGKGNPGDVFEVIGRSESSEWWEICCTQDITSSGSNNTISGWVSGTVVRLAGDQEGVAVSAASEQLLLEETLASEWAVDWQCGSERCEIKQCRADVRALVDGASDQQLLTIDHNVTWDDTCFATDSWVFDVNRFSGRERTGEYENNFLYGYWLGQAPGEANGAYTLPDERVVAVWCSGPHTVEIEEGSGWTTIYEGNTCHDVRTGMLVVLSYNKRWLFTGDFEGQSYERAYFGDNETLQQRLINTNVTLQFVARP